MRLRIGLAVALITVLGAACAEVDRRPAPLELPAQTVRGDGLALTALAGEWSGFPPDLDRYYLPIRAVIVNDRADAVPLRFADFALLDASGTARAAVPPQDATAVLFGTYGRRSAVDSPAVAPSAAVPGAAPGTAADAATLGATPGGAAVTPARTTFFFSGRFVYPFGYYYPYYPYYPYGYYYGPYYRGYRYRSYADLTGDLLRFGLREERIAPKAAIDGFLYFPRAEGDPKELRLRWSPPGLATPLVAPVAEVDDSNY